MRKIKTGDKLILKRDFPPFVVGTKFDVDCHEFSGEIIFNTSTVERKEVDTEVSTKSEENKIVTIKRQQYFLASIFGDFGGWRNWFNFCDEENEENEVDDLSYSGITNGIQGDIPKGINMIVKIASEKEVLDRQITGMEATLQQFKTRQLQIKRGALNIVKHLNKEIPLAVKQDDFIVVISNDDITIERNVI